MTSGVGVAAWHRGRSGAWAAAPRLEQEKYPGSRATLVIQDAGVREYALRAIDAARTAGATYADVRLTRIVRERFQPDFTSDEESYAIGVRALVRGYWGFAASPYWTIDEAALLARDAVAQATMNARGTPRDARLGVVAAASGHWTMPVQRDPFAMSPEEKIDYMQSWLASVSHYRRDLQPLTPDMEFVRRERALATTDGTYVTQTTYETGGAFSVARYVGSQPFGAAARGLTRSGCGWELFLDARIPSQLPRLAAEVDELARTPVKPVDIGRYDVVCDTATVAALVDGTIAAPTELDRAVGYEAGAAGTSYLGPDPLALLGTFDFQTPQLTVTADRAAPHALATTRWDDEGVEPETCALVTNGRLTDYQTTREQAPWLASWYGRTGRPVRSHGYAGAPSALDVTIQQPPNIVLAPGTADSAAATFETLIANVKRGYAVCDATVDMDHQARNGTGLFGQLREITNGTLGAVIAGGGFAFASVDLWKKLVAVGGPASAAWHALTRVKGQPRQQTWHSVHAVPLHFKEIAIIEPLRRA